MHAGHSELFKTLEAGIFALSLMILAIAQYPTFHFSYTLRSADSGNQTATISTSHQ